MLAIGRLRKYPIFEGLPDTELTWLSSKLRIRSFAADVYIFYQGNPCAYMYLVKSGLVRLFMTTVSGQETLIQLVRPPDTILPLLKNEQTRIIGAVAHQKTVLLALALEHYIELMNRSPQFLRNIYNDLSDDIRKLLLFIRSINTLNLNSLVAVMLLRLASMDKSGRYIINMPISQGAFASWLGASRGRVNQALHQLESLKLIGLQESRIEILDYPGLERMSEEQTMEEV